MAKEKLQNKNILITGGSGNIGLVLAKSLIGRCRSILLADVREPADADILQKDNNITFVKQDMTGDDIWRAFSGKVDVIFHLAAQTSTYRSNADLRADWAINVKPMAQLLELLRTDGWRPDVVFASTATVMGVNPRCPVEEDQREDPVTIYDIHKFVAEKYLRYYALNLSGKAAVLRLANVYGVGGAAASAPDRGIVNQMIKKVLAKEVLTVYGDGKYLRDYVHVNDVVGAFVAAAESIECFRGGPAFVAGGKGYTVKQLAENIVKVGQKLTGFKSKIVFVPFPEGSLAIEKRSFVADNRRLAKLTNWQPTVALPEGLQRTAEYFYSISEGGDQDECSN